MGEIEYNKLRLDILQKLIHQRGIECKMNKSEMVKTLLLYDEGKYVEPLRETIYVKENDGFFVGIDIKNTNHLLQVSKMMEKKEAKSIGRFSEDRVWYWTPQKLI